jgi:predicted Zn-dependent protease
LAAARFQKFEQTRILGEGEAAVQELRTAIALNPLDGRLPGLLGHVYGSLAAAVSSVGPSNDRASAWHHEALAAYQQAIALEPFQPFNRLELGRLYLAMGERGEAQAIVRSAVDLEPNFLPGREWLARFYLKSGLHEAADQEYREIQSRQQRYAHWVKDAVEERYLKADASALAVSLGQVKPPT